MALLIVDDEKDCRESMGELLRLAGYKVITAGSGEEALSLLRTNNITLLLVDLMMPEMSGEEFIRRAVKEGYRLPILAVTAIAPWKTQELTGMGVGYIRKPYESRVLLHAVETLLRKPQ